MWFLGAALQVKIIVNIAPHEGQPVHVSFTHLHHVALVEVLHDLLDCMLKSCCLDTMKNNSCIISGATIIARIIVPSRHTGIGAWVNSKLYTSILYNLILIQGYCTTTEYTGSLGYNSVSDGCLKKNQDRCTRLWGKNKCQNV